MLADVMEHNRKYKMKESGFGEYVIVTEKQALDIANKQSYVVLNFHKNGFKRCEILGNHLESICTEYTDVRFI
eukprot:UN27450